MSLTPIFSLYARSVKQNEPEEQERGARVGNGERASRGGGDCRGGERGHLRPRARGGNGGKDPPEGLHGEGWPPVLEGAHGERDAPLGMREPRGGLLHRAERERPAHHRARPAGPDGGTAREPAEPADGTVDPTRRGMNPLHPYFEVVRLLVVAFATYV